MSCSCHIRTTLILSCNVPYDEANCTDCSMSSSLSLKVWAQPNLMCDRQLHPFHLYLSEHCRQKQLLASGGFLNPAFSLFFHGFDFWSRLIQCEQISHLFYAQFSWNYLFSAAIIVSSPPETKETREFSHDLMFLRRSTREQIRSAEVLLSFARMSHSFNDYCPFRRLPLQKRSCFWRTVA